MINPKTFYNKNGFESGYQCRQCGDVVQSMWGNTCNKCRKQNEQHKELINAINYLTSQPSQHGTDKE